MLVQQVDRHVCVRFRAVHSFHQISTARLCSARSPFLCSRSIRHNRASSIVSADLLTCIRQVTAVNRRQCRVWASAEQQATPEGQQHDPIAAEDEVEDEGEWDEYEEYEEEEEGWEEDEGEQEAEAVAADSTTQIPMDATGVPYTRDDFVEVGLISRAHGVKGEVKVQLITDQPKKRLGTSGRRLWLLPPAGRQASAGITTSSSNMSGNSTMLQRVTVQSARVARPEAKDRRAEWAVKFNEVRDRDQAATLAGCKLLLALCDREAAPRSRDEFFITDLVGLKAVDADTQQLIGIVTEVYDSSASYSLLRVRLAPNEEDIAQSKYRSVLVPFVSEIVPDVDVQRGLMEVTLPEGLLETASSKKLRRPYTTEQQAQLRQQLKQRQQQQIQQQQQQEQQ